MPSATKNLFEKRFLDFQKLLLCKLEMGKMRKNGDGACFCAFVLKNFISERFFKH
jgi:hypothetical protein